MVILQVQGPKIRKISKQKQGALGLLGLVTPDTKFTSITAPFVSLKWVSTKQVKQHEGETEHLDFIFAGYVLVQ